MTETAPENVTDDPENAPERNAEAKYRKRAREAETALQNLQERVERMQRAEVQRIAGESLADPEDLFAVGKVELAALLSEDGELDSEAIADAVSALTEARPQLAKDYKGQPGLFGGYDGLFSAQGARGTSAGSGGQPVSWETAFRQAGAR